MFDTAQLASDELRLIAQSHHHDIDQESLPLDRDDYTVATLDLVDELALIESELHRRPFS